MIERNLRVATPDGFKNLNELTIHELRDLAVTLFEQLERSRETYQKIQELGKPTGWFRR